MSQNEEVILDQYRMLRSEIVSLIDETRKIESQVLAAIAALYAWLATHSEIETGVWYIATVLALFGGFRSLSLFVRMGDISAFMRDIEERWAKEIGGGWKGWETHFGGSNPNSLGPTKENRFPLCLVTIGYWVILLGVTLVAPCWLKPDKGADSIQQPTKMEISKPIQIKMIQDKTPGK